MFIPVTVMEPFVFKTATTTTTRSDNTRIALPGYISAGQPRPFITVTRIWNWYQAVKIGYASEIKETAIHKIVAGKVNRIATRQWCASKCIKKTPQLAEVSLNDVA